MSENEISPPMFDFYTRYYSAVESSKANAEYCTRLYGRNLCQHGFAEMKHLDYLIEKSGIQPGSHVLDLGCGNGYITEYIHDRTGAFVTGIDFIDIAIVQAKLRTYEKRHLIDFKMMDMFQLEFQPNSFDYVLSIDTLYFGDISDILRQLIPLYKPGGMLLAFFDQSAGPDVNLEDYPKSCLEPDQTDLGVSLNGFGISYQTWDFTLEMLNHIRNRFPVLQELKQEFENEGNEFLYENHLGEAYGISRAYLNNAGKRYLYLARMI